MCRFPASGSSRESFAHSGVSMDDPSCRQRVAREESGELSPIQAASPPRQPFLPDPSNLIGIPAKSPNVARYDRGRNGDCSPSPAQIRTGPIKTSGSYLEYLTAKRALGQGGRLRGWG